MFWNGSRWIDEAAEAKSLPKPSMNSGRRRFRDWAATGVMGLALMALIIPILGASVSAGQLPSELRPWVSGHTFTAFQESRTRIHYTGTWTTVRHPGYAGGLARAANKAGAKARIAFTGSGIAWVGPVGPTRGKANVYLDGKLTKVVDTHATHYAPSNVLYTTAFDTVGRHSLTVSVVGTTGHPTVAIDQFIVRGDTIAARGALSNRGGKNKPTPSPTSISPAATPVATPLATPVPTPADVGAPSIVDVAARDLTTTGATIGWTVSEVATGQVEYGPTIAYGTRSLAETSFAYSTHAQQLSGLQAATTYHYRVLSTTQSGASIVSGDQTFTTLGSTPDATPVPTPVAAPVATPVATPRPTAVPTPAPTAAPTPTPPPAAGRPFAAPVTSRTVTVPSTIDATGATNAGAALASFLGGVPDGSIIAFKAGGVYRLDRGLFISGRHNLVFEGNGATLRANGSNTLIAASPFLIDGANSDIVVRNFTIEGNNPNTGTAIYNPAGENQQGVAVYGGLRVEVANNTIRKTWGDAVYANEKDTTHTWTDGLWVHDNTIRTIGRIAFTMNGAKNALIERNSVDQIGGAVMDIEPDTAYQGAINVTLRDNTVGVYGLTPQYTQWFVACANNDYGPGAVVRGITISGNQVSGGAPSSANTPNAGGLATWFGKSRTSNITFTNNTTTKAGAGPVLRFEHVDGVTVTGNTQPLSSGSMISISDSTNVTR